MDPRFTANPPMESLSAALALWPELARKQARPLLVSAFGDIFLELSTGEVWVADPLELSCQPLARSVPQLEDMFANPEWAQARLLTEVVLLAEEKGRTRLETQVFAVAPHPCLGGQMRAETHHGFGGLARYLCSAPAKYCEVGGIRT